MTEWSIELHGDRHVLDELAANFDSSPCTILFDEGQDRHFLRLSAFESATDVIEVRQAAENELDTLTGALSLSGRSMRDPLRLGAVHSIDEGGRQQLFVTCSSVMSVAAFGHAVVVDALGNVITPPPDQRRLVQLAKLIGESDSVAKVSRLMRESDFATWTGLYRVFEVVSADVGGRDGLRDWVSERSIERFTRTANHPLAAGDGARHGHSNLEPPPRPMSLSEAHAWLIGLVCSWVELRLVEQSSGDIELSSI